MRQHACGDRPAVAAAGARGGSGRAVARLLLAAEQCITADTCCFRQLTSKHLPALPPHQRLLKGPGHGISCFTTSAAAGVIAVAEQVRRRMHAPVNLDCMQLLLQHAHTKPSKRTAPTQGPSPRVWVYHATDLQQPAATLRPGAELDVSALALSGDGQLLAVAGGQPGAALGVWQWATVSRCPLLWRLSTAHVSNTAGITGCMQLQTSNDVTTQRPSI